MTWVVVDASVAVKWFVPEIQSAAAQRFMEPGYRLCAPDLLWPEFGNILWKKQRVRQISLEAARRILSDFHRHRVAILPSEPFLRDALDIAERVGRTVYDSLYLAVAQRIGCRAVTADERLFNAVQGDPIAVHVQWIEDQH